MAFLFLPSPADPVGLRKSWALSARQRCPWNSWSWWHECLQRLGGMEVPSSGTTRNNGGIYTVQSVCSLMRIYIMSRYFMGCIRYSYYMVFYKIIKLYNYYIAKQHLSISCRDVYNSTRKSVGSLSETMYICVCHFRRAAAGMSVFAVFRGSRHTLRGGCFFPLSRLLYVAFCRMKETFDDATLRMSVVDDATAQKCWGGVGWGGLITIICMRSPMWLFQHALDSWCYLHLLTQTYS